MSLRFKFFGIGGIALFTLLACSGTEPTSSGAGGGGSGGTPSAGASTSGASGGGMSGSAESGAGGTSSGAAAGGSGGMPGGGTGGMPGGGSGGSAGAASGAGGSSGQGSKTTFFVTSDTSKTGDLGGLAGADMRCNTLAQAAGIGDHTFAAYLSSSAGPAKARIGSGPWYNAKGVLVAQDVAALHAMTGNADLFIDEKGMKINGQWENSPTPNEHDILTGSLADGTVREGYTCMDWTSDSADLQAQIGHSDGLGPNMDMSAPRNSWNSAHENGSCADTAPKGGAGRLYCFAVD